MEQVMGPLLFLLLGLPTLALAAHKGFHFVAQEKNWTDAQSYCREKFTDLATIQKQADWSRVSGMMAKAGHSAAWLGLYQDVKSWRWSLDNTSLYRTDLGSWFDFDQDHNDGAEHCAYLQEGRVFDSGCQAPRSSVCYHEPSNSYTILANPLSWQAARTYCRQFYTELASIRDQQELHAITSVTDRTVAYWMGLSREGWKWSDQSQSSFRLWRSDRPSGGSNDCGLALVDSWFDSSCAESYPFICSAPDRHSLVLRVALKSHGSLNMKDPRVQEAILKQMEKDLRAQGVTQPQLSLSWRRQPNAQLSFNKTEL